MKRLLLLGATGSIGSQTLSLLRENKANVTLVGAVSYQNQERLKEIQDEFKIPTLLIKDKSYREKEDFLDRIDADIALNALSTSEGLFWSLKSLERNMDLALSNKESIVMGYNLLEKTAKEHNKKIFPVDSEHSAIYQMLKRDRAKRLIITCSGGPLLHKRLENSTLSDALEHPTWKMGKKITIDSSTLANKGLEVIEASYLFGFKPEDIEVVIHRESIVHSMIEKYDGSIIAYISKPDMRLPIYLALNDEKANGMEVVDRIDLSKLTLRFERPNFNKFRMLPLAYEALKKGGAYPISYNAADEVLVEALINGQIKLTDIPRITHRVLQKDFSREPETFEEIMEEHRRASLFAKELI